MLPLRGRLFASTQRGLLYRGGPAALRGSPLAKTFLCRLTKSEKAVRRTSPPSSASCSPVLEEWYSLDDRLRTVRYRK